MQDSALVGSCFSTIVVRLTCQVMLINKTVTLTVVLQFPL